MFKPSFKKCKQSKSIWVLGIEGERLFAEDVKLKGINKNTLCHELKVNDLRIHLERERLGKGFISGFYLRAKAGLGKNPYQRELDTIPGWILP